MESIEVCLRRIVSAVDNNKRDKTKFTEALAHIATRELVDLRRGYNRKTFENALARLDTKAQDTIKCLLTEMPEDVLD